MFLTGCSGHGFGVNGGTFFAPRAPEKVRVVHDSIVIAGPHGYCVAKEAVHDNDKGAFVLLASCASVSGSSHQSKPDYPAILTATVAAEESGRPIARSSSQLKAFFTSPSGKAALSKQGKAETVTILSTLEKDGVFYLHARDTGDSTTTKDGGDLWRAMLDIRGRVVSTSLVGLGGSPIPEKAALKTLLDFSRRLQAENPSDDTPGYPQQKKARRPGLLRRLFP